MAKVLDLLHCPPWKDNANEAEYLNLLANAVNIKEGGQDLPAFVQSFIKLELFYYGHVGYSGMLKDWFRDSKAGRLNIYGRYNRANFFSLNGRSWQVTLDYEPKAEGNYTIDALPLRGVTFYGIIHKSCEYIAECERSKIQNVRATKFSKIITCRDDNLRNSIIQACMQIDTGAPMTIVSPELGEALKGEDLNTPFMADRLQEAEDIERNHLLSKLGIMSANTGKRERVQSAEVNATIGEATDYIYMLIDHFNKQCETYGLPFEMEFNGSLEELYEGDDVNEIEQRQEAGAES